MRLCKITVKTSLPARGVDNFFYNKNLPKPLGLIVAKTLHSVFRFWILQGLPISAYSGMELSLTKMMGQLQDAGNVTTLAGYLEILDQCALLTGLQKYANDEARKRGSMPKYQVYNNALLTAYKGRTFVTDRTDTLVWGRWVESAVGAHLLSMADELDYQVYYWRDPARNKDEKDKEVDFVLLRDGEVTAIEVKSGRRGMNSGLPAFVEAFHPKRSFVVGTGGVNLEDFLGCEVEEIFRH